VVGYQFLEGTCIHRAEARDWNISSTSLARIEVRQPQAY